MNNSKEVNSDNSWNSGRLLIALGFVLSIIWMAAAIWFPWCYHKVPGVPEWCIVDPYWGQASFGETGDYLTGWLTPLALFWFVITVFLQRYELIQQRREFIKGREAAEEQADHLKKSNDVRREQIIIDLIKESQEVRKTHIYIISILIQSTGSSEKGDFDVRKAVGELRDVRVEQLCHSCLGHAEALMRNSGNYRIDSDAADVKELYLFLKRHLAFYEGISIRTRDLNIEQLDNYLVGPMELKFRDACDIILRKLDSANPDLHQWYAKGPISYGSRAWQDVLAVDKR